jgi:hypothetical protein
VKGCERFFKNQNVSLLGVRGPFITLHGVKSEGLWRLPVKLLKRAKSILEVSLHNSSLGWPPE